MKTSGRNVLILMITLLSCNNLIINAQNDSIANLPQFLFPEFVNSLVRLKQGETVPAVMNYNTLTEKMTFYQNGKLMDLDKQETVDTIFLQNLIFVPLENAFFQVLVNAPIALFIQNKSKLSSTGNPGAYGTTSQTVGPTSIDKYYSSDSRIYNLKLPKNYKVIPANVYWIRVNNVMHSFLAESQFLKIFPAKKDEIKQFIHNSKINMNKPEDLVKLVNFCNELTN